MKSLMYWGRSSEVGAKVEVGEIDGAEEGVVGDDRVEEDVDGRERGDLGGGRAGRKRRSTPVAQQRWGPGRRREAGDHFSFATGL